MIWLTQRRKGAKMPPFASLREFPISTPFCQNIPDKTSDLFGYQPK